MYRRIVVFAAESTLIGPFIASLHVREDDILCHTRTRLVNFVPIGDVGFPVYARYQMAREILHLLELHQAYCALVRPDAVVRVRTVPCCCTVG